MTLNDKHRLLDVIERASASRVQTIICSECQGALEIQYTQRKRRVLSVACARCVWRVIRDGLDQEPPWVKVLGRKVHTKEATVQVDGA